MSVSAPARKGILGELSGRLPKVEGKRLFPPRKIALKITNRCNAECVICNDGNDRGRFESFEIFSALNILTEIAKRNPLKDKGCLHLWGGEPFLEPDLLSEIINGADKLGYGRIEVATNGFWGKDVKEARDLMQDMARQTEYADFYLQLSCDNFHNTQDILRTDYLANILYLGEKEFPWFHYEINSLSLNDDESLRALARKLTNKAPGEREVVFEGENAGDLIVKHLGTNKILKIIPTNFIVPSISGRYDHSLSSMFAKGNIDPKKIPYINAPIDPYLSIDIDRQLYIHKLFTSPKILPMGSVGEYSIKELISRIEMDPIAVSLLEHGYSEIYPHLKEIYPNFDTWARQFYSYYDIFQGLETDEPSLAHYQGKL